MASVTQSTQQRKEGEGGEISIFSPSIVQKQSGKKADLSASKPTSKASKGGHSKSSGTQNRTPKSTVKGDHCDKNARKKQNRKGNADKSRTLPSGEVPVDWRFQLRLVNGFEFTEQMMNALLRYLNTILYSLPLGKPTPSFSGYGLRFGRIWFAPSNQDSSSWLKQILETASARSKESERFVIEPFTLHQNSVNLLVPWDPEENLTPEDVTRRLLALNPGLDIARWSFVGVKPYEKHRLFYWIVTDESAEALRDQNFTLDYSFKKLLARVN